MLKVLVADNNLDSHELVDDMLEINFKNVKIDRALSNESLLNKIQAADPQYNLILFNLEMGKDSNEDVISQIRSMNPELLDRLVLVADSALDLQTSFPVISKPFSLDYFGEIVKKTCVC